jgi:hypothetical protein
MSVWFITGSSRGFGRALVQAALERATPSSPRLASLSSCRSSSTPTRMTWLPSHLLLGVTAVTMALDYSQQQLAEATEWSAVSRSADFAESYPVELPPDSAPS